MCPTWELPPGRSGPEDGPIWPETISRAARNMEIVQNKEIAQKSGTNDFER